MKPTYLLYINFRRLLRESISAFKAAHRLGYAVMVIGKSLPEVLQPYVDHYEYCDPSDQKMLETCIEKMIRQFVIEGIVCATETAVEASAIIGERLGLPTLSLRTATAVRDKSILREKTKTIDQHVTLLLEIENPEQLLAKLHAYTQSNGFPYVIKPVNASGSTGIFVVHSQKDIDRFMSAMESIENTQYDTYSRRTQTAFIVEPYLDGQEYSVEGFVFNGEVFIVGVTYKETSEPYRLEIRHVFPALLTNEDERAIHRKVEIYLHALDINNASFHLEGKLQHKQGKVDFYLIETAARPGGDYITSHLVPLALGYDFYENLARVSLKQNPQPVRERTCVAGIHYIFAEKEGILRGYTGLDKIMEHPLVQHIFVEVPQGETIILPPKDFRKQRVIAVLSTASSHAHLQQHLDWVQETLHPEISLL